MYSNPSEENQMDCEEIYRMNEELTAVLLSAESQMGDVVSDALQCLQESMQSIMPALIQLNE